MGIPKKIDTSRISAHLFHGLTDWTARPFKRLSPETVAKLAALQREQSAEDLNYWRPAVVLVEQCVPNHSCQGLGGKNFDMLSWFLQSPEFAAAWSHYRRQPGFDNYEVYKTAP